MASTRSTDSASQGRRAMETLSRRGAALSSKPPVAEYIVEHLARGDDRWHATDNPGGYVPLCIAENILMADLLLPRLAAAPPPPGRVLGYDAMVGALEFRDQLAGFLDRTILGRRFRPDQIAVLAGAGTVLEAVFHALGDPGDAVLVPTPSYAGFWPDLETRDELRVVPVPCGTEDGFALTTERLDAAMDKAERPVKALLFTNPDNPIGKVASVEQIETVLRWAESHDLHVVFDEVYAMSVFGDTPFRSVASVRSELGSRVHIVWAFSKDFGASGLRCGVLVSENEALLAAVDGLAYWGAVSGHTQWVLGQVVADREFVDHYQIELRRRLGEAHRLVGESLDQALVVAMRAEAGIFVLCDFREYLAAQTFEAEHALWRRILDEANVNLTPGAACRIAEPGFMRLCYAAEPAAAVREGIARIASVLR